jgi:aryl-alcohol dehydrogenase-like predicted oxidoreductase
VAEVRDILGRAREVGIDLLDTAECYGDRVLERLIGKAIEGRRSEGFVATKIGHRYTGHFERDQLWSAEAVLRQLDASLDALRTDYVDLYRFPSGTRAAFDDRELWSALAERSARAASATSGSRSARAPTTWASSPACRSPAATWALAWCLQHPAVTCVVPVCKSVAQVEANARAAELDLVRDDHPLAVAAA